MTAQEIALATYPHAAANWQPGDGYRREAQRSELAARIEALILERTESLRAELAEARKRYCYNCSEEMPEGVYEFCSEKCQEVFINIKTGQTDL